MKTYTASVVGAGAGGRLSLRALEASDRYELAAVADVRPEALEAIRQEYPHVETFASHQEMFAQRPTDVVCVSTWPPSHKDVTLDALEMDSLKGLLVEKPLADRTADARALLDAIQARRLPLAVPHGLLALSHSLEILDRVRAGDIGALKLVEIQCDKWDIINAGIHWLHYFVNLVQGEPMAWVMCQCDASTRTYRDGMQVETMAVTYIQTASGVRCVMQTGDFVDVNREGKGVVFRLVGDAGLIEFWAWEGAYILMNEEHPGGERIERPNRNKPNHQLRLEEVAEHIDAGTCDYEMAERSLQALELCEAAYWSNRYGCKVDLPLDGFAHPAPPEWDPGMPYSGRAGGRDGRKL